MNIAAVCLWLKERVGGKISEDEIQTGAFSEALRLVISELKADIEENEHRQQLFIELNDIDKEVALFDGMTCTEIGIDKCIDLFEKYNKIYNSLRGDKK
ncbi:MAG: hypothetical protein IJ723_02225 [Ruminococcus sp.]|nr:hypothetical protein [Ruminococcus sp.]